jgi:FlaA1/EpsC-like NDP-sugar epimerase
MLEIRIFRTTRAQGVGGIILRQSYWRGRRIAQATWDAISWAIAVPTAVFLRYDFSIPNRLIILAFFSGVMAAILYLIAGSFLHHYRGRYVVGTFDEVLGVVTTSLFVGIIGTVVVLLIPESAFPRSTFIIATGIAASSMLGARFIWRGARRHKALQRAGKRTLIYGAGDAGSQIVQLMLNDKNHDYQPIGFIDDDPRKHHLRRSGIRVLGDQSQLEALCDEYMIDTVLIAIAGVSAAQLLEFDQRCQALGVRVAIIPTASEIVGGAVRLGDISDLTEEDLMGRRPIETDEYEITRFIQGKRILITGAGGSIGSELARQVNRYRPAELFLLDRDESALHSVQLTLDGSGNLMSSNLILTDIRDVEAVVQAVQYAEPDIVFHAAALKHLPLLERYPDEALKTNVHGTRNVIEALETSGCDTFVNISTDKAADPVSVLGKSKLITEQMTAHAAASGRGKYISVRFGNVLGSRGSVIETFRFQIAHGGPVTITDENVSRYFMTVKEAVHLVLQAAVIGESGATLVLDMGTSVRILDLARRMVNRSGRDIDIEFIGLRPGEKMEERVQGVNEVAERTAHDFISSTKVEAIVDVPLRL